MSQERQIDIIETTHKTCFEFIDANFGNIRMNVLMENENTMYAQDTKRYDEIIALFDSLIRMKDREYEYNIASMTGDNIYRDMAMNISFELEKLKEIREKVIFLKESNTY